VVEQQTRNKEQGTSENSVSQPGTYVPDLGSEIGVQNWSAFQE